MKYCLDARLRARVYPWYVTAVLILAYTFSFIDRTILSLLVEPIKRDLGLSDTSVSLVQGFAFALLLAFCGLPMGRLVDRRRRMTLISGGIAFWSVMTAGCGLAGSTLQLLLCRAGVGAGESTLTPAAYSVLADYFPPRRLGTALGIYGTAAYLGAGLALVIGGAIIAHLPPIRGFHPWQAVFLVVGLPGLGVALWTATLKEPGRSGVLRGELPLPAVIAYFKANLRTVLSLDLMIAFAAMMAYGVSAWVPSFLIRTYGWSAVEAGRSYGMVMALAGALGAIAGGVIGDRAGGGNSRLRMMTAASLAAAPFFLLAPLAAEPRTALLLLGSGMFFVTMTIASGPAAQQEMMPNQMRGVSIALGVLIVNLIGLGLGPTVIALVTDRVIGDESKLRYALAGAAPVMLLLSAACGGFCLKPYLASRDYLRAWCREEAG